MITVGLPVYNSNQIAWLAMEGLCNQKKNYTWELIICEEQHKNQCELVINNVKATYIPINIEDMLIRLKRALWNNQPDSQVEVNEQNANWAINKGYAEKVEKTEYSNKQDKSVIENKEADNVPSKRKGRKPNH